MRCPEKHSFVVLGERCHKMGNLLVADEHCSEKDSFAVAEERCLFSGRYNLNEIWIEVLIAFTILFSFRM